MTNEEMKILDRVRGSMFGGAIGDALGYTIEHMSEEEIFGIYGKDGITAYQLDSKTGKALISDDTQMSLFTANGLLICETRANVQGIGTRPRTDVSFCYRDWFLTQTHSFDDVQLRRNTKLDGQSWLLDVPELFSLRSPGTTCMTGLRSHEASSSKRPLNNSKAG
ncbi:MAG: ADP-ribosylglycohydrolase family protein, partial [Clostridia bacterium]|nr:ADP-ribosylglycohydrolase family protein [Clostridia bacterium]